MYQYNSKENIYVCENIRKDDDHAIGESQFCCSTSSRIQQNPPTTPQYADTPDKREHPHPHLSRTKSHSPPEIGSCLTPKIKNQLRGSSMGKKTAKFPRTKALTMPP